MGKRNTQKSQKLGSGGLQGLRLKSARLLTAQLFFFHPSKEEAKTKSAKSIRQKNYRELGYIKFIRNKVHYWMANEVFLISVSGTFDPIHIRKMSNDSSQATDSPTCQGLEPINIWPSLALLWLGEGQNVHILPSGLLSSLQSSLALNKCPGS